MKGRLSNMVVLVTGGSRGIGRATSILFAREGAKVCVNYQRSADKAKSVADEVRSLGSEAMTAKADVSRVLEVKRMVRGVVKKFGRIDVLVNCAGIIYTGDSMTIDDWKVKAMYAVNVEGVLNCAREAARYMIPRHSGKIINISSVAAVGTSINGTLHYSMTKTAVVSFTKKLALELGAKGIRVNAIAPGYIDTDLNRAGKTEAEFERVARDYSNRTILRRIGKPEEIATVALFLASEESSFITGQTLTVDGGRIDIISHSL